MQVGSERVQGMEQQEFHSVIAVQGAASDAQLQLSSSTLTTSPSSSQTSPDRNSSTMSSPTATVHLPAQRNLTITIVPRFKPPYLTREQALKSVKESIPHSMKLQQLQKSEKGHQKDARWHRRTVRRLSKELYQIVSLYALLQGVIFAAVAQSSVFTCADWWGPACVVGAVTVATISRALDKLRRMRQEKQEVRKFERRQSAVYDKIEVLRWRGSACSIESLEPVVDGFGDQDKACIFSVQGMLVLGFLVGFSALILASCRLMLCSPCYCKASNTP